MSDHITPLVGSQLALMLMSFNLRLTLIEETFDQMHSHCENPVSLLYLVYLGVHYVMCPFYKVGVWFNAKIYLCSVVCISLDDTWWGPTLSVPSGI